MLLIKTNQLISQILNLTLLFPSNKKLVTLTKS